MQFNHLTTTQADIDSFVLWSMKTFKAVAALIFVWVWLGGLDGSGY